MNHEHCTQTASGITVYESIEPKLPSCVVDVRQSNGSQQLRLVETHGACEHYVTLSLLGPKAEASSQEGKRQSQGSS